MTAPHDLPESSQTMSIRRGTPADCSAIATLIASFQAELTDDPNGVGAETFLDSVSVDAERGYLSSPRYTFLLAEIDAELAGFIAIRDGTHLFHLFVARHRQGRGIARRLWEEAQALFGEPSEQHPYTVSSSLRAIPVYRAFGFRAIASVSQLHGVSFLPMRLPGLDP